MPGKEIVHPLPRSYIEDYEDRSNLHASFVLYVWQAVTALKLQFRDFPEDVYAIGDNWAFLVSGRKEPLSPAERKFASQHPGYLFPDIYSMEQRSNGGDGKVSEIDDFLKSLRADVEAGEIEERVLEKIAILDRTSRFFRLFDEKGVVEVRRCPWGRIITITGHEDTLIYHIQNEVRPKIRIHISSQDL